ncbi:MAG: zinc-ribbon domain-containing protein [Burkholderiaceae bacterium]|nr:zinc-ribbon domain-containing protein [Burkholderiaceae bacterium]
MALATRCPNCQALFRVVADQLKLRGGLVRCGACRHVFDAIGTLSYVDDNLAVAPDPTPARKGAPPTLHASAQATPVLRAPLAEPPGERTPPAAAAPVAHAPPPGREAEPQRAVTDRAATTATPDSAPPADEGRRAPRKAAAARSEPAPVHTAPPPRAERDAPAEPPLAPDFLRPPAPPARGFSIVYGGGSVLLALLMLAQLAVVFRTELATRWPQWRPALVTLCSAFGCQVGWPTRADLLAVVGSELQALPGTDVLELTATIRNRANFKVALPALEVTLTDTTNRTLARKVFAPVDYLASAGEPSSRIADGIAAGSDYTIRVAFEARGLAPAGFVVYPFYL